MGLFRNAEIVPLSEVPEPHDEQRMHDNRNDGPVVLVVDDEPSVADSMAAILKLSGYTAVTAYNGLSALELAIAMPPALLISDFAMPGMNGVELAIAVLANLPDCNVLLFSGHATHDDLAPAREAGYDLTLLAKPLHPKEMLRQISESLRSRGHKKPQAHPFPTMAKGTKSSLAESA
jgi:DNA-binding NtrC family response regulator